MKALQKILLIGLMLTVCIGAKITKVQDTDRDSKNLEYSKKMKINTIKVVPYESGEHVETKEEKIDMAKIEIELDEDGSSHALKKNEEVIDIKNIVIKLNEDVETIAVHESIESSLKKKMEQRKRKYTKCIRNHLLGIIIDYIGTPENNSNESSSDPIQLSEGSNDPVQYDNISKRYLFNTIIFSSRSMKKISKLYLKFFYHQEIYENAFRELLSKCEYIKPNLTDRHFMGKIKFFDQFFKDFDQNPHKMVRDWRTKFQSIISERMDVSKLLCYGAHSGCCDFKYPTLIPSLFYAVECEGCGYFGRMLQLNSNIRNCEIDGDLGEYLYSQFYTYHGYDYDNTHVSQKNIVPYINLKYIFPIAFCQKHKFEKYAIIKRNFLFILFYLFLVSAFGFAFYGAFENDF